LLWDLVHPGKEGGYTTSDSTGGHKKNYVLNSALSSEVLRCYSTVFDVDSNWRDNEILTLEWLGPIGIAPKLFYFAKESTMGSFSVIEYFKGVPLSPMQIKTYMAEILPLLKRIHDVEITTHFREKSLPIYEQFLQFNSRIEIAPDFSLTDVKDSLLALKPSIEQFAKKYGEIFAQIPRTKLIHGDAHCGNILFDEAEKSFHWIDWEATHIGHPMEDLASISVVMYPLMTKEEEKSFLLTYFTEYTDLNDEQWRLYYLYRFRKLTQVIGFIMKALTQLQAKGQPFSEQVTGGLRFFIDQLKSLLSLTI